ncbi:hypothetical protein [Arcobacter arenosus]|uniref:Transposase n=1 Tax=Arcobacter arenosus TaxID=2576037 RepID=A0A5R8XY37_9BACT|nr:hypothetical protein [Arcobacter arenosus]TLP36209.1 hypothetical protein FDK22_13140 [Arcobacter arenosus]
MNKKLLEFMRKNTPRKRFSVLEKYEDEIMQLNISNFTHEQILTYLVETYEIKITRQSISKFIKKKKQLKNTEKDNLKIEEDKKNDLKNMFKKHL